MIGRCLRLNLVVCAAIVCGVGSYSFETAAQAEDPARAAAFPRLKALLEKARAKLRPLAKNQIDAARGELVAKLQELDAWLDENGETGEQWRTYLAIEALKKTLDPAGEVNPTLLNLIQARFNAKHAGLERAEFAATATALRQFRELTRAVKAAPAEPEVNQQYDSLIQLVSATSPQTPEQLDQASRAVGMLELTDTMPEVVEAVRSEFSRPNLFMHISESFVSRGMGRPVSEHNRTANCDNGAFIQTNTLTLGNVSTEFIPNEQQGVLRAMLLGTAHTGSVVHKGPAIVHARATTHLSGQFAICFDENGVGASSALTSADTSICFSGFGSTKRGMVGRIVRRVAAKKAPEQRRASEISANQKANTQLNEQLNKQALELVAKANEQYREKFKLPLVRYNAYPRVLKVATTADDLRLTVAHDDRFHLAAPNDPPALSGDADLSLQFHESFFNNMTGSLFSARTIKQEDFDAIMVKNVGKVPEPLKPDAEDEDAKGPWSVTFAKTEPFTLRIVDSTATLTIRGRRFTTGDKSYEAMNITVRYRFEREGAAIVAIREGEVQTLPPDFKPGDRLSSKQTVLARMLRKQMGKLFKERVDIGGIELPGQFAKLGELNPQQWHADQGWLVVGMKAQPKQAAAIVGVQAAVSPAAELLATGK